MKKTAGGWVITGRGGELLNIANDDYKFAKRALRQLTAIYRKVTDRIGSEGYSLQRVQHEIQAELKKSWGASGV
jgi:hypothetical protein